MTTYKIGNKLTGIIRSFHAGSLGNQTMEYDNQPYTIFYGKEGSISFNSQDMNATINDFTILNYNHDTIRDVTIRNVDLTEKIMALIFKEAADPLASIAENYTSDENKTIYLNTNKVIYQVFVYDIAGNLEAAYSSITDAKITVENANTNYLIVYSWLQQKAYTLNKPENTYVKLDLIVNGNQDNNTQQMYIHLDKCALRLNKTLNFNQATNTVDLIFTIIDSKQNNDYIVVE